MLDPMINERLRDFLREDLGPGDLTTDNLDALSGKRARARFCARESGVLAGLPFAEELLRLIDPAVVVQPGGCLEGGELESGTLIAALEGQAGALLKGERTALNLLQRLSGIATETRRFVQALAGSKTRLLDTRKTTPGFRFFEKYAVRVGGGGNHRLGLFDGVMLKDNHIVAAGGILPAVAKIRRRVPVTIKIEVETETLAQVQEALAAGAEIIMLDNMAPSLMAEAVRLVAGRALTEASGRISWEELPAIMAAGVDFVSTSAMITRSHWLDIGLDFDT